MADIPHGPSGLTIASSCPPPFLNQADYRAGNGYVAGRICQQLSTDLTCCLPCPQLDWFYPLGFYHRSRGPGHVATASLALTILMLLSWAVLPTSKTKRHYLNVALVFSIFLAELGLSVPTLRKPAKCFDPITPNNQRTSKTCGASGALLFAGFAAIDIWVLIRALTMHMLIVWDQSQLPYNFLVSNLLGWGIVGIMLTTSITASGYSCLVGDLCITNARHSWVSFWGPLLCIAGISTILTFITAAYCTFIYMRSILQGSEPLGKGSNTHGNSGRNSDGPNSPATPHAATLAVWRRVRAVLRIQWRPVVLTTLVLLTVITAAAVAAVSFEFIGTAQNRPAGYQKWLICLAVSPDNHDACLKELPSQVPTEATVLTPFYLISILGFIVCPILGTKGMITGWWDLIRGETPLKLNTERFNLKRKHSSNGKSTTGVNKADISRPRFPRFSFQPNPGAAAAAASVPATHTNEAQSQSIEPFEQAHVPHSLTMGGHPLGPIPKPLTTGPREETSRTALTAAYSTANDVQTPQKRGLPGAGLGIATPRNRGSSSMQPDVPLSLHPVAGHGGEHEEEDEEEHGRDSLFEESLVGQTPSKVV